MAQQSRGSVFYGWYIVGSVCLALLLGFASTYAFASFFTPLSRAFDANRASLAGPYALALAAANGLGAITGSLADRFGPRPLVLAGGVLIGAGMLLASRADAIWQLYLTYGVGVGLGGACILVPGNGAVQRWFVRRRGLASGLAVTGTALGNLLGPPIAALLLRAFDWPAVFVMLGIVSALGIGAASLLLSPSPASRGLQPDGDPSPSAAGPPAPVAGATLRTVLASRRFWLLYAALAVGGLGMFFPLTQLVPDAEAHGIHPVTAATLLGLVGAGSLGGRLLLGSAADRLGRRHVLVAAFLGMGVFLAWWLVADRTWSLAVFALGFGLWYGGVFALAPAMAADLFGAGHAGATIGLLYTGLVPGALIGPPLAGAAYERFDSYAVPIIASVIAMAVAALCTFALPSPRPAAAAPAKLPAP